LASMCLKAVALTDSDISQNCEIIIKLYPPAQDETFIVSDIVTQNPVIVGFSCYLWNINQVLKISQLLKARLPNIIIILGGPEVRPYAEDILHNNLSIDIIIIGEGEITFKELVRMCLFPDPPDPSPTPFWRGVIRAGKGLKDIEGITFRDGVAIISTKDRPLIDDLDTIPMIYEDSIYQNFYKNILPIPMDPVEMVTLETSRGCPFKCKFCTWTSLGRKIRFFSLERIEKVFASLSQRNKDITLYFIDSDVFLYKERAKAIINLLKQYFSDKASLNFDTNPDSLDKESLELINDPRFFLMINLQTINPEAQKCYGRTINVENLNGLVTHLREKGDNFQPSLTWQIIFGLPEDTLEWFKKSLDFALSLGFLPRAYVSILHFSGISGSQFVRESAKYGLVFEATALHKLISSNTFSKKDIREVAVLSYYVTFLQRQPDLRNTLFNIGSLLKDKVKRPYLSAYENFITLLQKRGLVRASDAKRQFVYTGISLIPPPRNNFIASIKVLMAEYESDIVNRYYKTRPNGLSCPNAVRRASGRKGIMPQQQSWLIQRARVRIAFDEIAQSSNPPVWTTNKGLWTEEAKLITQDSEPGSLILDIGAGLGREGLALAQMGYRVIGLDISFKMLKKADEIARAQQATPKAGLPEALIKFPLIVADAVHLPFKDQVSDMSLMLFNLIQYIPGRLQRLKALNEAYRCLKPGKIILVQAAAPGFVTHLRMAYLGPLWLKRLLGGIHYLIIAMTNLAINYKRRFFQILWGRYYRGLEPYDEVNPSGDHVFFHWYHETEMNADLLRVGFTVPPKRDPPRKLSGLPTSFGKVASSCSSRSVSEVPIISSGLAESRHEVSGWLRHERGFLASGRRPIPNEIP